MMRLITVELYGLCPVCDFFGEKIMTCCIFYFTIWLYTTTLTSSPVTYISDKIWRRVTFLESKIILSLTYDQKDLTEVEKKTQINLRLTEH